MLDINEIELRALKELPKRTPWPQVMSQINDAFPTLKGFNWRKVFDDDPVLFASLLRGVLGLEGTRRHTWGPRPQPSMEEAKERLKQWEGSDHSFLPFQETFKQMASGMTERQLAHKVGIPRSTLQNLIAGRVQPDAYAMETIAKAFKKEPSFWLEYRILFITRALIERMREYAPEASVSIYQKLTGMNR